MDGYIITYVDKKGQKEDTFFSDPVSSFGGGFDGAEIIRVMFFNAHPGCKIISMKRAAFSSFVSGNV